MSISNKRQKNNTGYTSYTETDSEYDAMSDLEYVEIRKEINSIDDLIELGEKYQKQRKRTLYNIDVKTLSKLVRPLKQLKAMIGMQNVKETIIDLIVYYMQDFEHTNSNMLHTVIQGPPGCGKTTVARIIADIYLKLGILHNNTFIIARRSDLIGKYLGSTAIKTQKVIDSAYQGVLFIDEAYALGNNEQRDSFSKECIDTINQNLTEEKCNFICIIAGYKKHLQSCFFDVNPGLERRFPFRYQIEPYSPAELKRIYINMVQIAEWSFIDGLPTLNFFERNMNHFTFNGGDMETLFQMTKLAHSRRVFCLDPKHKKVITQKDLDRALELIIKNKIHKNETNKTPFGMYL